jgi:hypothetical protein
VSCGETSELTAARAHAVVALLMLATVVAEVLSAVLHGVMCVWHGRSVFTHLERAKENGEHAAIEG